MSTRPESFIGSCRTWIAPRSYGLLGLLALCLVALAGCSFGTEAASAGSTPTQSPAVAQRATATPIPPRPTADAAAAANDATTDIATGTRIYPGDVMAEDRVEVIVEVSGRVLAVNADVGDSVSAGDVLLEVDPTALEARQAQALAALEAAQAQLDLLLEEPTETDLAAARAAVAAAEAAYQRALEGPTEEDLRAAEARLRQAEAAVSQAQAAFDLVKGQANVGALPQSLQLEQATLQLEAARAEYDKLVNSPTADVIAAAYAQVTKAQAALATLEEGAKDSQIRAARAQVRQAETNLYLAQLELDKATVEAPIDGVVAAVYTALGAQAAPGAPVFALETHTVKVEVDVEEGRLATLYVGQPARIQVTAYPGRVFDGSVSLIAPNLDPATRTVQVTVLPTGDAADLRPGMYANVEILP